MKRSMVRKARRIARALVPKRRDRYFWWEQDEPREGGASPYPRRDRQRKGEPVRSLRNVHLDAAGGRGARHLTRRAAGPLT
jgi:hypothetical protein